MDAQMLDLSTSSYDDAWRYTQDLERRGYSVTLAAKLEGSTWWWNIKGSRPPPPHPRSRDPVADSKVEPARCELCGELMPEGETMFKYHGYSGPCPKPPLKKQRAFSYDSECENLARHFLSDIAREDLAKELAQHIQDTIELWLEYEAAKRGGIAPKFGG